MKGDPYAPKIPDIYADNVVEFHDAFAHPINAILDIGLLVLRSDLIREEFHEFDEAVDKVLADLYSGKPPTQDHYANLLKEMADLQYVLSGMAVALGMPLKEAFLEVHESNMSKLGDDGKPIYREDGKVLKGPNYQKPDLRQLVPSYCTI